MPFLTRDPHTILAEANAALEHEDEICRQEIEALQTFHDRARSIVAGGAGSVDITDRSAANAPLASRSSPVFVSGKDRRSQLLTAYRRTVMSVPGTDEFESDIRTHLTAELGGDTAEAIYASSGPSTGIMPVLHGRVSAAIRQREGMRRQVKVEAQSLEHLGETLLGIYDEI